MNIADITYTNLLRNILDNGELVNTRNSFTITNFNLPNVTFTEFPLITLRKTAAKKAISEMEWFMSGISKCPDNLLDWWKGQLDSDECLIKGYPEQFRNFADKGNGYGGFDQVKFILDGIHNSPNSRRLLLTMWHSEDMAYITDYNNNPNTPTCCHSIIVQFFVRQGKLHMKTYQRSADMLLGVPHNWVQSWALLLFLAYHSDLEVGSMTWMWGDAHIYKEETHLQAASTLIEHTDFNCACDCNVSLQYTPEEVTYDEEGVPVFRATDFTIVGPIPAPILTSKINMI